MGPTANLKSYNIYIPEYPKSLETGKTVYLIFQHFGYPVE